MTLLTHLLSLAHHLASTLDHLAHALSNGLVQLVLTAGLNWLVGGQ